MKRRDCPDCITVSVHHRSNFFYIFDRREFIPFLILKKRLISFNERLLIRSQEFLTCQLIMLGLAIGFIPTGVGMLLIYQIAKKHPGSARNLQLEQEERNIYINSKLVIRLFGFPTGISSLLQYLAMPLTCQCRSLQSSH